MPYGENVKALEAFRTPENAQILYGLGGGQVEVGTAAEAKPERVNTAPIMKKPARRPVAKSKV